MPKVIGKSITVVDTGSFTIDECVGNVATKQDQVSVARVCVTEPTEEPWLTLEYDEWICVFKGRIDLHHSDGNTITSVKAGETAFVAKGERFRPVFPVGDTEYVPVCIPAFKPDRCHREDEADSEVSKKLKELHAGSTNGIAATNTTATYADIDTLYHMCQRSLWDEATKDGKAYFPPTFVKDGRFTHATAVPQRLIETANHFYTAVPGEWICLQLSRAALLKLGIETVFEEAKPVGETEVGTSWDWVCPHIFGGIPTHIDGVVTKTYPMKREEDGSFVCIVGLTDE